MSGRWLCGLTIGLLAACGGERPAPPAGDTTTTAAPATAVPAGSNAPLPPPGTVDTQGVGVNPPTAGGQVVDTAAVPGPVDTAAGTATAP
jgi:hypothetical protein